MILHGGVGKERKGLFAVLGDKSKEHQQPGFETKMRKRRRKYRELWSRKERGKPYAVQKPKVWNLTLLQRKIK